MPRGDAARLGRAAARCCCRCGRPALVAEEIAWLAARFPGRVGLGVASGALPADFEIMHVPMDGLAARFTAGFEELAGMLDGTRRGVLADDPAIAALRDHPVPVLSAAMSFTAVRRAARLGAGLLFDSLSTPERCRELIDAYRDAGGTGPCVLIRRAWVGEPPREQRRRPGRRVPQLLVEVPRWQHWGSDELRRRADRRRGRRAGCVDALRRAPAPTRCNLRVHVPGVVTGGRPRADRAASATRCCPRLRAQRAGRRPATR